MVEPQILRGLSLAEYHAVPSPWVSHSRLHDFIERGAAYYEKRYLTGELEREVTTALELGQAFEDLFQRGGDGFAETVAVMPAHFKDGRSKAAQEFKAAARAQGKVVITDEDYQALLGMCASLRTCEKGMQLIEGAEEQLTLRGEVFGLPMQSRPDWVHLSDFGAYTVDLKSCRNLNDFLKEGSVAVWNFGYFSQAAIARQLLAVNGYENASAYLLVAEKQAPYRRACFQIPADYLAWGDQQLSAECAKLKACVDTGVFPLGPDEIVQLQKPRWVRDEPQQVQP